MVSFDSVPNWLLILKEEKFFTRCLIHETEKKNIFCLDCCTGICLQCLPFHHSHVILQIRRYMYNDVLRLGDAQALLNCSLVQSYTTNKTKVVFLKQRPPTRSHKLKGSNNICITCDRNLQDPYIFCSVSCKVHQHLLISKNTTIKDSRNEYELFVLLDKESRENTQQIEDSQMTTDSVLDSPTSTTLCTLSGSTSTNSGGVAESVAESFKKKRSSVDMVPEIWSSMVNRRKGVPHRSPFY